MLFPPFLRSVSVPPSSGWKVHAARPRCISPLLLVFLACSVLSGCVRPLHPRMHHDSDAIPEARLSNPLQISASDPDLVWEQVSEAVMMFFSIQREERVRVLDDVVLEGRIETHPEVGSTIFEPWRHDSTAGKERWLATLQSIRRRAVVRVIPSPSGFLVDVAVHKELEDVNQPEHATVARADPQPERRRTFQDEEGIRGIGQTVGWIPLGRDERLEQRILGDIQARLAPQA